MTENKVIYKNIYSVAERKQLVADMLKAYRKQNKFTQQEVADKIGINVQTYATYERGRNEAPAEVIVRLSYLYDIPTDILLQKSNVAKDMFEAKEIIKAYEETIFDMQGKIISGDEKTREQVKELNDTLSSFVSLVKEKFEEIEKANKEE